MAQLVSMHAPGETGSRGPHLEPSVHMPRRQRLAVPTGEERPRRALPDEPQEVVLDPAPEQHAVASVALPVDGDFAAPEVERTFTSQGNASLCIVDVPGM